MKAERGPKGRALVSISDQYQSISKPGIVSARQGPRSGKRGLRIEQAGRRIVDHASSALIGIFDIARIADTLARESLGAGIEEGAFLNDDSGPRPAVFVAAYLNRPVAVVDHGRLPRPARLGIRRSRRQ